MVVHGIAHLPGFLVSWQLRSFPQMPFRTTILGSSLDVGELGIKAIGLAWLALSVSFGILGVATLIRAAWWQPTAYVAIGVSTALCFLGWPDARLGLIANAIILVLIVIGSRARWV